jgi:Icc-related predicted phosphoesterase
MTNEFNPDWLCVCGDLTALGIVHRKDGPCYIPEPKREWVGLTDEAIWSEYQTLWPFHPAEEPRLAKDIAKFARAIEAKLKAKNSL